MEYSESEPGNLNLRVKMKKINKSKGDKVVMCIIFGTEIILTMIYA